MDKLPYKKDEIIDWIYSNQICGENAGGFRGSDIFGSLDSKTKNSRYDYSNLTAAYSAMASLIMLGDDLECLNRQALLNVLKSHQNENGRYYKNLIAISFRILSVDSESDMRFVFSACAIAYILDDFSTIDVEKIVNYIKRSVSYDYGIGQGPGQESHGGSTFCAIASLYLLNRLNEIDTQKTLSWCLKRQGIGFQGRINKQEDSCYSFWVGSSIKMLCDSDNNFINSDYLTSFISQCQFTYGGIAKHNDTYPDISHTFFALAGLSLLMPSRSRNRPRSYSDVDASESPNAAGSISPGSSQDSLDQQLTELPPPAAPFPNNDEKRESLIETKRRSGTDLTEESGKRKTRTIEENYKNIKFKLIDEQAHLIDLEIQSVKSGNRINLQRKGENEEFRKQIFENDKLKERQNIANRNLYKFQREATIKAYEAQAEAIERQFEYDKKMLMHSMMRKMISDLKQLETEFLESNEVKSQNAFINGMVLDAENNNLTYPKTSGTSYLDEQLISIELQEDEINHDLQLINQEISFPKTLESPVFLQTPQNELKFNLQFPNSDVSKRQTSKQMLQEQMVFTNGGRLHYYGTVFSPEQNVIITDKQNSTIHGLISSVSQNEILIKKADGNKLKYTLNSITSGSIKIQLA
ncbi:terpenoid cyclases/Protein prenyltransferase [Rozella allomycis CSF55]|uniref:Terpenoid cyclases/Protein prenyltransferase n=1 Tax=Rozella allomycis (strain CSF55) TaxID=988480 RepID=A0A4V1IZY0_ROZAC|nr:terpenoid cyclases/Protein prenyltransferase [Rozella allomycis CSF55]